MYTAGRDVSLDRSDAHTQELCSRRLVAGDVQCLSNYLLLNRFQAVGDVSRVRIGLSDGLAVGTSDVGCDGGRCAGRTFLPGRNAHPFDVIEGDRTTGSKAMSPFVHQAQEHR